MIIVSPGEHETSISDCQAVQSSYCHVDHLLPPEALHHGGLPHVLICPVTQSEVITLAPGPDHAGLAEGEAELCSTLNLDEKV